MYLIVVVVYPTTPVAELTETDRKPLENVMILNWIADVWSKSERWVKNQVGNCHCYAFEMYLVDPRIWYGMMSIVRSTTAWSHRSDRILIGAFIDFQIMDFIGGRGKGCLKRNCCSLDMKCKLIICISNPPTAEQSSDLSVRNDSSISLRFSKFALEPNFNAESQNNVRIFIPIKRSGWQLDMHVDKVWFSREQLNQLRPPIFSTVVNSSPSYES